MDATVRLRTGDRGNGRARGAQATVETAHGELERGDEIVLSKFSNAVQGVRELASFIELCRIKVIRIISIHDRIDSRGCAVS